MFLEFELNKVDREAFSRPWGVLLKDVREAKPLIKGKLITVGDVSTSEAIRADLKPAVAIVDGKVKRRPFDLELHGFHTVSAVNGAGTVSSDLWQAVETALKRENAAIRIDGEDDLAVIPAVMLSANGTSIIYGQPDEGIVHIEVDTAIKEKLGRFLHNYIVMKGKEFINGLKPSDSVFLVHHTDADGVSAAAIILKALQDIGIKKIRTGITRDTPHINQEVQSEIVEFDPDVLIVVDLGNESAPFLKRMAEGKRVGIFDHHRLFGEDFGGATVVNPLLFHATETLNPSASHLVYLVCGVGHTDWLAVLGTIGDKGESKIPELVKSVEERYSLPLEQLRELSKLLDSAETYEKGNADIALEALKECEKPQDLLRSESEHVKRLRGYRAEIKEEFDLLTSEHEKKADIYSRLIVYQIESKFGLKGDIANFLQEEYPNKVILVWSDRARIRLSMRTRLPIDLASLIKKSLKGLDGKGGGHRPAAGAEIAKEDFPEFLERVKGELK